MDTADRQPDRPIARSARPRPPLAVGRRPTAVLAAFFAAALTMLAAAGLALIGDAAGSSPHWHWLVLHLALLGGVSQLILGAGQFFVCAFLATTPPSARLVNVQLGLWNAGTVLVVTGVIASIDPLVDAGAVLVIAGLALFAGSMAAMRKRSLQQARWALRWYEGAAGCLLIGVIVGALLARGVAWTHGSLLGAHLALNVAGWIGMAIIGTLHTFFPSLTGTRLHHERLQAPTLVLWLTGTCELALAAAFGSDLLATLAWAQLLAAALLLAANLLASLRTRAAPPALPLRLVALAQAFLPAGLVLGLAATAADGAGGPIGPDVRAPLAILLLAGWVALTVAGSLLHLLGLLAHVRHFLGGMDAIHRGRDIATAVLAGLAIAVWALAQAGGLDWLDVPALVLRLTALAAIGGQIAAAAWKAIPRRPNRSSGVPHIAQR